MTCGSVNGVASGAVDNNIGAEGAKAATEKSGTGKRIKKRESDAAVQVWSGSGAGRNIFADDEGNAVEIEEDSAFAT